MTDPIVAGQPVRVTNAPGFKDAAGALFDPATVRLLWYRHGEAQTIWLVAAGQVVRDSLGLYHADIPATEPGLHHVRWDAGPGAAGPAIEGTFSVTSDFIVGVP